MKQIIYKQWTTSAIDCYRRGCTCSGCLMHEMLGKRCQMKRAVFELVKRFGAPDINENGLSRSEQKIIDAILSGCNTKAEIAAYCETSQPAIQHFLVNLYRIAESDGLVFMNGSKKLPDLINWVRGQ